MGSEAFKLKKRIEKRYLTAAVKIMSLNILHGEK